MIVIDLDNGSKITYKMVTDDEETRVVAALKKEIKKGESVIVGKDALVLHYNNELVGNLVRIACDKIKEIKLI